MNIAVAFLGRALSLLMRDIKLTRRQFNIDIHSPESNLYLHFDHFDSVARRTTYFALPAAAIFGFHPLQDLTRILLPNTA